MSKVATLLGLIIGAWMLSLNVYDQHGALIDAFFNGPGLALVLGGTIAAILINYTLRDAWAAFKAFAKVFTAEPASHQVIIAELIRLSHDVKKQGFLAIENQLDAIKDPFLKYALTEMLINESATSFTLKQSLDNHLVNMRIRHLTSQEVYGNMASYAPAFGMLGTVMGLIIMMTTQVSASGMDSFYAAADAQNMVSALLAGMGLALVTTFYGVLLANFIFLPVAGKLKVLSEAEIVTNEIIVHGVVGIKNAVPTLLLKENLLTFVNEQTKQKLEDLK